MWKTVWWLLGASSPELPSNPVTPVLVSTTQQLPTLMISEAPVTTAAAQEHPECSQVGQWVNRV